MCLLVNQLTIRIFDNVAINYAELLKCRAVLYMIVLDRLNLFYELSFVLLLHRNKSIFKHVTKHCNLIKYFRYRIIRQR